MSDNAWWLWICALCAAAMVGIAWAAAWHNVTVTRAYIESGMEERFEPGTTQKRWAYPEKAGDK